MPYQSIPDQPDIEQISAILDELDEPESAPESVPQKVQVIGRTQIFVTMFFFLVVTIVNWSWHPHKTTPALSEFKTNCLSRDYGPVKEGYDLVRRLLRPLLLVSSFISRPPKPSHTRFLSLK